MKLNYKNEDIAIIGMECKFANANSVEEYWDLLYNNKSGIREIKSERWPAELYSEGDLEPGKTKTKWGGLLSWFDKFDPAFFGISPLEAERIDPQQKLLLMTSYAAFEDAGLTMDKIRKSRTGVFIGMSYSDFSAIALKNRKSINANTGSGIAFCMAANRLSYVFDLKGPSMSLDAACSSSIASLNLACESLWRGSSDMAIAGGSSLNIWPDTTIIFSQSGMLSPDGQCKTFDDSANGFVKGEGIGVVIVKRLSDAIRDNNRIHGVIKGIRINHNGKSNGITAPNRFQQKALIQEAIIDSGINPNNISFIETHGTGTPLGDPIEFNALTDVFMEDRSESNPCYLGAVKTNVGHLEASSGIAGVIKVLLSMKHKIIPANLNLKKVNKYLALDDTEFVLPTENVSWEPKSGKRIAGVSSFGFGGSNGHVILQEYNVSKKTKLTNALPFNIFTVSANCKKSFDALIKCYIDYLKNNESDSFSDICFATQIHRSHFDFRRAFVCKDKDDLLKQLNELDTSEISLKKSGKKVAFLFTGQGTQYLGMAKELYFNNDTFKYYIDKCSSIVKTLSDIEILDFITSDKESEDSINETIFTQPVLFAVEYALVKTLEYLGVKPEILIGHSLGELVAACIANVFGLEDGLKIAIKRGGLLQCTSDKGRMINVFSDVKTIGNLISSFDQLSIAAKNGINSNVVSGHSDQINLLIDVLKKEKIHYKTLTVKRAFHSPLMDSILHVFENDLSDIVFKKPEIPLISNLDGQYKNEHFTSIEYWKTHIRNTTDFVSGMEKLKSNDCDVLIEIGTNPILINLFQKHLPEDEIDDYSFASMLRQGKNSYQEFLNGLATIYNLGFDLNWNHLCNRNPVFVDLPKYKYNLETYWLPEYDKICKNLVPLESLTTKTTTNLNGSKMPLNLNGHFNNGKPKKPINCQLDVETTVFKLLNKVLVHPINDVKKAKNSYLHEIGVESIMVFNLRSQLKKRITGLNEVPMELFATATLGELIVYIEKKADEAKNELDVEPNSKYTNAHLELMKLWTKDFDVQKPLRIDQKLVHKHVLKNVLIARTEKLKEDLFLLEMTQDIEHPFFYEHYLDHVPAMYMLEAILQAARVLPHSYYEIPFNTFFVINEMESRFDEFAELNVPVFFLIEMTDKAYKNEQLHYGTLDCKIYQKFKQIGEVKGTGQFFKKDNYKDIRAKKMDLLFSKLDYEK